MVKILFVTLCPTLLRLIMFYVIAYSGSYSRIGRNVEYNFSFHPSFSQSGKDPIWKFFVWSNQKTSESREWRFYNKSSNCWQNHKYKFICQIICLSTTFGDNKSMFLAWDVVGSLHYSSSDWTNVRRCLLSVFSECTVWSLSILEKPWGGLAILRVHSSRLGTDLLLKVIYGCVRV